MLPYRGAARRHASDARVNRINGLAPRRHCRNSNGAVPHALRSLCLGRCAIMRRGTRHWKGMSRRPSGVARWPYLQLRRRAGGAAGAWRGVASQRIVHLWLRGPRVHYQGAVLPAGQAGRCGTSTLPHCCCHHVCCTCTAGTWPPFWTCYSLCL